VQTVELRDLRMVEKKVVLLVDWTDEKSETTKVARKVARKEN
jgi:hypothetical protein